MPSELMKQFPFSAIYGLDDVKRALGCVAVNHNIKTALIRGSAGVAKTTSVRSFGEICRRKVINVPIGITEDDLFGGMDVEAAIKEGRPVLKKGLMASADGNILYIDDANLMDQKILYEVTDNVVSGKVTIERGGISSSYECDTILIATMNPDDTDISSHMLDRFDICAYATYPEDHNERKEILRRTSSFSKDSVKFVNEYKEQQIDIITKIEKAKKIMPLVTISDELLSIIAELCGKMRADGHRGDIAMFHTSKSLAALNGRDEVNTKDVEEAASLCLVHRRNHSPSPPQQDDQKQSEEEQSEDSDGNDDLQPPKEENEQEHDDGNDDLQPPKEENEQEHDDEKDGSSPPEPEPPDADLEDMMFRIGEQFRIIDYMDSGPERINVTNSRKGKRKVTESADGTGRYARARMPSNRSYDFALDATIRAAAPYQKSRDKNGMAIAIESQDMREKVRERRSGSTILFLVDASGSLGVRKRMEAVKGAMLSMLRDSYVKRDKIGMMVFRRSSAELVIPPTKSVEYSYRMLEELPTGGKTPLAEALERAASFMGTYARSHSGEKCHIVVLTDGRANVPISKGADANEEVLKLAESISLPNVKWIVIDASSGYIRFDNARKLAEKLEGTYLSIEDLNADKLARSIRDAVNT